MGTFQTGTGSQGYASEGFRKGGGVTRIKTGGKYSKGKIIYDKNSAKKKTTPITRKEEPQNYNLTTPQGENVQVTRNPASNYPAVRVAQTFRADLTTEQAQRIAQKNPEVLRNRSYIAVSGEDINRINEDFRNQDYNAPRLINEINQGRITKGENGNIIIQGTETTNEEILNIPVPTPAPPKDAIEYLNKNYFGVTDYFKKLMNTGIQNQAIATADIYKNKKVSKNDIINFLAGKIQLGIGSAGTVAGTFTEPAIYGLSQKRRYDKGIPEAELQSGIYEPIITKEQEQTLTGIQQLSALTQGLQIKPSEAVPVKAFPKLEKEPYIFIKPYEEPFRLPKITRTPEGTLNIEPTTTIRGGLGFNTNEPNPITQINFKSLGDTEKKIIVITEPPTPQGIQSQIYPKSITTEAFNPSELPSPKEIKTVLNRQYNGKLSISPAEMEEPELIPKYKQDLYNAITYTEPKTTAVNQEEIFKVFRNENPSETQTELKTYLKATSKKTPITPKEVILTEDTSPGRKGLIMGKKAQASLTIGKQNLDNSNNIYETYKPGETGRYIIDFGKTELSTESNKGFVISPEITRNEYNFNTGNQNIVETINSAKIRITPATEINSNIRTKTETETESGSRSRTRTDTIPATIIQPVTINDQPEPDKPLFNPVRYKSPYEPKTPEEKTQQPKPDIYKKLRQQQEKQQTQNINGFNVFIKNKGLFNKINNKPVNLQQAIKLGAEKVERTSSASFKVTPQGKNSLFPGIITTKIPPGFYAKKGIFIEKPSKRINTLGEIQQISFKGITSKRIRKLFGG